MSGLRVEGRKKVWGQRMGMTAEGDLMGWCVRDRTKRPRNDDDDDDDD